MFFWKAVQGIFKIALRLRNQHVFRRQSLAILIVLNALTLKQVFWKTKAFLEKLQYCFSVESTRLKAQNLYTKLPCQRPTLKKNIMGSRKWPCLYFWTFYFSLRIFYKEVIWCTTYQKSSYSCISFIWGKFFPVSILKDFPKKWVSRFWRQ